MQASARHRLLVAFVVVITVALSWTAGASAHEGESSDKAADLVRQAIAVLVNEPENTDAAADKLNDASTAADQTGVDAKQLAAAKDALAGGDVHRARALAELSIGAQPHIAVADVPAIGETTPTTAAPVGQMPGAGMPAAQTTSGSPMPMATGSDPGVAAFADPLSVRPALSGRDWAVLGVSIGLGLVGVFLALRFRPPRHEARS